MSSLYIAGVTQRLTSGSRVAELRNSYDTAAQLHVEHVERGTLAVQLLAALEHVELEWVERVPSEQQQVEQPAGERQHVGLWESQLVAELPGLNAEQRHPLQQYMEPENRCPSPRR